MEKRIEVMDWLKIAISELTENPDMLHELQPNSDLEEIGINSILFIRLLVEIEQHHEIMFSDDEMLVDSFVNVEGLLERILQLQTA